MSGSLSVSEHIQQARQSSQAPFRFPFTSFAQCFYDRVNHPVLSGQIFLSYYDDDTRVHRSYTYAEFGEVVCRMATLLRDHLGVKWGDRVATVLFNHDQTVALYFAAWVVGAVVVPINIEEPENTKRYILEHSGSTVVFCWHEVFDEIHSLKSDLPSLREVIRVQEKPEPGTLADLFNGVRPRGGVWGGILNDDALIVYTSGTTGAPKGVVLSTENLLIDAEGIATWHGFRTGDALMCVLPIHHVNGIVVTLLTPFYFKGRVVLNRKFKTPSFWSRVQNEQVACVSVVPTLLEFLLESPAETSQYRLDHFRGVICGAGPLLKETVSRFEDHFGVPIRHGYGLSETTCYSCFLPTDLPTKEHRGWLMDYEFPSIGVPIPHNDMAILDDQGRPVPENVQGEICIRGQNVCSGYLQRPDANKAAFQWGWFRSGDAGFFLRDDRGRPFFFISGRLKELIIRGGVNISPLEIDEVLTGAPSIKFGMAVPFENRYYGEEIAAYVVPQPGQPQPPESMVLDFCRQRLPFAKCPKVVVYGEEVPYTTTGKPKRLELKNRLKETLANFRETRFTNGRPKPTASA